MAGLRIEQVPITHPDAVTLIAEVQQEYVVRYGGIDESPIDAAEFEPGVGAFFIGYVDDVPVATGAWRLRAVDVPGLGRTAEIKRMYVVPAHQRRGLARRMLAHLEQTAAAAGVESLILETGTAQPEAIALYGSSGYARIADFGHYRDAPEVRSFARPLDDPAQRFWDAEAEHFDDEPDHGLVDATVRLAWRDLLLGVLPEPPARVLDLGCGTGTLSVLLAEHRYAVSALDLSPRMVERARVKADQAGVTISCAVGDAAHPVTDESDYDVVLSRHVLWALPDPAEAIGRWRELLAPTGRLVLVEGRWHTGAGIRAREVAGLVTRAGLEADVRPLTDPALWGGSTDDERFLVVARQASDTSRRS